MYVCNSDNVNSVESYILYFEDKCVKVDVHPLFCRLHMMEIEKCECMYDTSRYTKSL